MKKKLRGKDLDSKVAEALARNPGITNQKLANRFNIHLRTAEGSIRRLRERKWVSPVKQRPVDLTASRAIFRYRVDITINPRELQENKDIAKIGTVWNTEKPQEMLAHYIMEVVAPECGEVTVEEIAILLGDPADLSATVLVPHHDAIYNFVTSHVRGVLGIEQTSTSLVAWKTIAGDRPPPRKRSTSELKYKTVGNRG